MPTVRIRLSRPAAEDALSSSFLLHALQKNEVTRAYLFVYCRKPSFCPGLNTRILEQRPPCQQAWSNRKLCGGLRASVSALRDKPRGTAGNNSVLPPSFGKCCQTAGFAIDAAAPFDGDVRDMLFRRWIVSADRDNWCFMIVQYYA